MRLAIALLCFLLCLGTAVPETSPAAAEDRDLYIEARKALQQGKYDDAVTLLSRAILLNPYDHRYFNDRGVAHKRQGKLNLALNDYADALRINPDSADALNNRGVVHLQRGDFKKAIEDFTAALKSGAHKGRCFTNRGLAYLKDGAVDLAIADLRKAIVTGSANSRAYYYLAQALEAKGEKKKAFRMYELASQISKGSDFASIIKKRKQNLWIKKRRPEQVPAMALRKEPNRKKTELAVALSRNTKRAKHHKFQLKKSKPKLLETSIQSRSAVDTVTVGTPETLSDLREGLLSVAVKKFPGDVSRIFLQAEDFLIRSQNRKALVRFEDAQKLAERKRNRLASAWCTLQIGRIYSQANEHTIAVRHFRAALSEFHRMKKHDELLVALALLARSNAIMGKNKRARHQFMMAAKKARAADYLQLGLTLQNAFRRIKLFSKPGIEIFALDEKTKPRQIPRSHITSLKGKQLLSIGRWPATKDRSRKQQKTSDTMARILKGELKPYLKVHDTENLQQPKRQVFVLPHIQNREAAIIRAYLRTLKSLRRHGDEANMIVILEKLASKYAELKHYQRALHCLTVSLALREKLGLRQGMGKVFYAIGSMYEELNCPVRAMENFARAGIPETDGRGSKISRIAAKRARELAYKWEWNVGDVIRGLEHYWYARTNGSLENEAQAVHKLVRFYQDAKLYSDALRLMELMNAVSLAYKAQLLKKLGRVREASSAYAKALKRLKNLDYSRYLQLIRAQRNMTRLMDINRISMHF